MAVLIDEQERHKEYLKALENRQYKHAEEVWHRVHQGTYIGDLVYGANDGIITTFAVVAGAAGAALPPGIIIILGLANLVADGISMGASSFLSKTSERDFYNSQRKREEWEVQNFPEIEKEETRDIFRKWGMKEELVEPVLQDTIKNRETWIDLMMREELDLHESGSANPLKHGIVTFFAFVAAGTLPLTPYFFGVVPVLQFPVAVAATGISLFVVGAARTVITITSWWRSGLEMLLVGGVAAGAAYFIGWALKVLVNVAI